MSLLEALRSSVHRATMPRPPARLTPLTKSSAFALYVTLWPSMPHFTRFVHDARLGGIRLNSAMMTAADLDRELPLIGPAVQAAKPLFFDIKGRQLRITAVEEHPDHLELVLNHPITVTTPTPVLFKAGADGALLDHLEEEGCRLVFQGGPQYGLVPGESLHIRHPSLQVRGDLFSAVERAKITRVKAAGLTRWFLSYVEGQRDVDQFLELVGRDQEVWLKIESPAGLRYVAQEFQPRPNLTLVAARGDLYVELPQPHLILDALRLIRERDPGACVGSRLMLSLATSSTVTTRLMHRLIGEFGFTPSQVKALAADLYDPVPACADWHELAWLYDLGYRRFMLCDELCLQEELLSTAVNAVQAFADSYGAGEKRRGRA